MKKTIVALMALVGTALSAYGQGAVALNTLVEGSVDAAILRADGTTGPGAAGRAQLYLVSGGSETPLTPATGFLTTFGAVGEKYLEGVDVVIPGNTGTPAQLLLKAWIGAAGSTYDSALERGFSNTITVSPGVSPNPPANLVGLTGFTMTVIPEPSTIALGVLGAAALLLRRRK